jgi:hypothetical protein
MRVNHIRATVAFKTLDESFAVNHCTHAMNRLLWVKHQYVSYKKEIIIFFLISIGMKVG